MHLWKAGQLSFKEPGPVHCIKLKDKVLQDVLFERHQSSKIMECSLEAISTKIQPA